jgi:hypothetical protein
MSKTITTTKPTHLLTQCWILVQQFLNQTKKEIMQATGWSERTFYNKLKQGEANKLKLTADEEKAIGEVLEKYVQNLFPNQKEQRA